MFTVKKRISVSESTLKVRFTNLQRNYKPFIDLFLKVLAVLDTFLFELKRVRKIKVFAGKILVEGKSSTYQNLGNVLPSIHKGMIRTFFCFRKV